MKQTLMPTTRQRQCMIEQHKIQRHHDTTASIPDITDTSVLQLHNTYIVVQNDNRIFTDSSAKCT